MTTLSTTSLTPRAQLDALVVLINSAAQEAIAEYERTGDVPSTESMHPRDDATATLGLRKAIRILEGACEQLCTTLAPPAHTLVNRSYVQFEPACIKVALQANIAGILVGHPEGLPVADIGKEAGIQPEKLRQILRFLAAKNCFREVREGVFANNRLSCQLVAGTQIANLLLLLVGTTFGAADSLHAWLKDPQYGLSDQPAGSAFIYNIKDQGRSDLFDWLRHNPEWEKTFASGMVGFTKMYGDAGFLVQIYPFGDLPDKSTFCDVGGGVGHISLEVAKAHPNMHITLQDQPNVVEQGRKFFSVEYPQALKNDQIDFVPIDFLKEGPVKDQDVYYLRHVIHNWSDADAIQILKNIRAVMKPSSRLLILEFIIWSPQQADSSNERDPGLAPGPLLPNFGAGSIRPYYQDINMMTLLNSKERSLNEFKAIGAYAGLEFVKVWDFAVNGMVEFKVPA